MVYVIPKHGGKNQAIIDELSKRVNAVMMLHSNVAQRWIYNASLPDAQFGRMNELESYCMHCGYASPCPSMVAIS